MDLPSYLRPIEQVITGQAQLTTGQAQLTTGQVTLQPSQSINTTLAPSFSDAYKQENKKTLRFMLVSTHVQQYTGYSKVSYGILNELAKNPNLDLIHFGFQKHPQPVPGFRPYPSNVEVIDAASLEQPLQQGFGYQHLMEQIKKKNPHIVMIYNDMAVVTRFLEGFCYYEFKQKSAKKAI